MSDSLNFFNALRPKILELITRENADCLRMSPYVVSVPADPQTGLIGLTRITEAGTPQMKETTNPPKKIGLPSSEGRGDPLGRGVTLNAPRQRFNSPVIFVPYHQSLSTAPAGTSVLLVYRGNLSNAYALPSF